MTRRYVQHPDRSVELEDSHKASFSKYEYIKVLQLSPSDLKFLIPRSVQEIISIGLEFDLEVEEEQANLTIDKLIDRFDIKIGNETVDSTYINDEYRIIAANIRNDDYYKSGRGFYAIDNKLGFTKFTVDKKVSIFVPLFSVIELTHVNPSLMNNEIYIQFITKPIEKMEIKNPSLAIWYNSSPENSKHRTRQRLIRAEREYMTVSATANQKVDITLHNGMKECIAVVIFLREKSATEFLTMDNIKQITLKIGECRITRNFNHMTLYRQNTKHFAMIRLTPGYRDFEEALLSRRHYAGREILSNNNNALSFNIADKIVGTKSVEITVLYFGYNCVRFDSRDGITIIK